MNFSSSLINDRLALVIDASVLISIHSCTYGKLILSAIPNGIIVPKVVPASSSGGLQTNCFCQSW